MLVLVTPYTATFHFPFQGLFSVYHKQQAYYHKEKMETKKGLGGYAD